MLKKILINILVMFPVLAMATSANTSRDYWRQCTPKEKAGITKLTTSMAKYSWPELLTHRSSLKKIGDEINDVHPLRLLEEIFKNKNLTGAFHTVRSRSLVWSEYSSGLYESLETETKKSNLKMAHIEDFAKSLKIDPALIAPSIQKKRWSDFLDILFKQFPRQGNTDRYDI